MMRWNALKPNHMMVNISGQYGNLFLFVRNYNEKERNVIKKNTFTLSYLTTFKIESTI